METLFTLVFDKDTLLYFCTCIVGNSENDEFKELQIKDYFDALNYDYTVKNMVFCHYLYNSFNYDQFLVIPVLCCIVFILGLGYD